VFQSAASPAEEITYEDLPGKQQDLFVVLDSWEALNMAQIDKLDKLSHFEHSGRNRKQLETK
jgi:hypothetical protein